MKKNGTQRSALSAQFISTMMIILFLGMAMSFAATSPFQAFLLGNPRKIHPLVVSNTIYLPLVEVASLFHLKADVDLKLKRIILEPDSSPPAPADATKERSPDDVILGQIESVVTPATERPFSNVKVLLFKNNDKYDEETNRSAIRKWILANDTFYSETHGEVAKTVSGADGHFAFSKIPPGDYEIVAIHPLTSREIGFWWIPLHLSKGEVKELQLLSRDLNRVPLK